MTPARTVIFDALAAEHLMTPDLPPDATAEIPVYPDPGPVLTARHDGPSEGGPSPFQVFELADAVLRRLAVIEAKLDRLLEEPR